jgi:hypothetical protein
MSTNTSIGPDADRGSNDNSGNADGCGNKTLGSEATGRAPTGVEQVFPDGPNVAPSANELDAARGTLPKER